MPTDLTPTLWKEESIVSWDTHCASVSVMDLTWADSSISQECITNE